MPEGIDPPRLIVCEQGGRWAVALRGHLGDSGPRLYETRSLAECWAMLCRCPASFLIVEVTWANAEALAQRMAQFERHYPLARMAVVAGRDLAGLEWLLREAGSVHFATSPRHAGSLAQVVCRHLARMPKLKQTYVQRVWAELPWSGERTRD